MKHIFIVTFLCLSLLMIVNSNENERQNIILKPTYNEGFGVVFKKELLIKKSIVNAPDNIQNENKEILYFIINPKDENDIIVIRAFTTSVEEALEATFRETEAVKVHAICFESILASGIPSEGNNISSEDEITLPSGPGWTIQNIIYLISFKE